MATKIWGPLGWMTLHSISAIYPEKPSFADMEILKKFMDFFAATIIFFLLQISFSENV